MKEIKNKREELNFIKEALLAFRFLIDDYGFRLIKTDSPVLLRYESDLLFVNITHDRISYELDFEIGSIDNESDSFSLSDLAFFQTGVEDQSSFFFQASTSEHVKYCVFKMAEMVRKYAQVALRGDLSVFDAMKKNQIERASLSQKEVFCKTVRHEADVAWKQKNFALVTELLEKIAADLTPHELKRLEYCKKNNV